MEKNTKLYYLGFVVQYLAIFAILPAVYALSNMLVEMDDHEEDSLEGNRMKFLLYVHVPLLCLVIVAIISVMIISRRVSRHVLLQVSGDCPLKESVKSAWVNVGIVSALLLSITTSLHNETEDKNTIVGQWYGSLMLLSTCFEICAMMMACVYTMYIEGLSEAAVEKLVGELPYIIGRPVLLMLVGTFCMTAAFVLSTIENYGSFTGVTFSCLFLGFITYALLEWYCIGNFKNDIDCRGFKVTYSINAKREESKRMTSEVCPSPCSFGNQRE